MESVRIRRRLLKWGNAYGVRITRAEARRLGLQEKDPMVVEVRPQKSTLDPSRLHMVDLGPDASRRHREWAREAADARN